MAPKAALVTAGSAGLGAAIAKVLAGELGMSVVINYASNAARAEATVAELKTLGESWAKKNGGGAPVYAAVQADMAQRAAVQTLVQETTAKTGGRLDVVVSNVGWTKMRNFMDLDDNMDEEDWDRCYAVNVKSHLWLFHAARPFLEASHEETEGQSVFVSTASVAGVVPSGSSLPYAVTKAAQIHMIRSLAAISAPKIRVNSVSPGVLLTEWGLSFPPEKLAAFKERNKLHRFVTVEEVAEQVKTYVTSKSITGQNAVLDAGFTL